MTYKSKLKDPRWQKKRLEIFNRDKWMCRHCSCEDKTLHVHHKEYIKDLDPWEYDNKYLITLCEDCHEIITRISKRCDIKYKDIRFYVSENWTDDSKIIYYKYLDEFGCAMCCMEIFEKNNNKVIGFNLPPNEIRNITRIFNNVMNSPK